MASGGRQPHTLGPTPLRNVEQITNASQQYEYNAQVPLKYWLRTATALVKEADIYLREGDEETAYLLLYRHAHLILAQLQAHPEAKSSAVLNEARKDVSRNLKTLDQLKPRINQRYDRYNQLLQERKVRPNNVESTHSTTGTTRPPPASSQNVQQLHGHEHSKLAVELAHRERSRRAGGRSGDNKLQTSPSDVSKQLQAIQMLADWNRASNQGLSQSENQSPSAYNYPSVRSHQHSQAAFPQNVDNGVQSYQQRTSSLATALQPPALPPKAVALETQSPPPTRPDKIAPTAKVSDSHSEPTYTFTSTATLENGAPLRTLFLPPTLRTTFLRLAHKNTLANLETCAFLAGTLIANALFVSKLIVPAQVATSDTCEMTNESQLFDYVDNEKDLMVLGWIHTHPTQTCFMSSRDLHTHAGYQMMLAESIAIVCAPSKGDTSRGGDWGAYRLTDPPGKMTILNCDRPGIFHPHDVDNIYTDALKPGHVVEAGGLEFEVVDLRNP